MTREEMLEHLASEGENAGSDYHDGLDGWFGFTIEHNDIAPVLRVTWESAATGEKQVERWKLTHARP